MVTLEIKSDDYLDKQFVSMWYDMKSRRLDWLTFIRHLDASIVGVSYDIYCDVTTFKFKSEADKTWFLLKWV